MHENEGFMKYLSFLDVNLGWKQLSLLPLEDFFRSFSGCKLSIDPFLIKRPKNSNILNILRRHWGLLPEEFGEIEWIGYRECQVILHWVWKCSYH